MLINTNNPFLETSNPNVFALAPIPIWKETFVNEDLHNHLFNLGFHNLSEAQKRMGQELPDRYDAERQSFFSLVDRSIPYWTEATEYNPIGSRFYTPPNDFLNIADQGVYHLKEVIRNRFHQLLNSIAVEHKEDSVITESWIQYYNPTEGRGHNQHNHCRWHPNEEPRIGYAGGYYLSDGEPLKDHPYSGAFCFHLRGMTHFIRPQRGMLMMWPYDIVHSVKPFYGKSHRCVINFNIQIP
jgi:hypothetical protein